MGRSLQAKILSAALKGLKRELTAMDRSEKAFLERYRTARLHAFELEFLAKFLRKSRPANLEIFERLNLAAKDLEDRLGEFNEIDEMISFCEKHVINFGLGRPAAEVYKDLRAKNYSGLKKWIKAAGWSGTFSAVDQIEKLLAGLEDLDDSELRAAAIKKMTKVLIELQENTDAGAYNPKKSSGYTMKEVEPKVHELRREIRKIPMYAGYLNGVFSLSEEPAASSKGAERALKYFAPLTKTPIARSPFAKLPKAKISRPLSIPRPFYLAVTKYVSELGFAKDWAQNLERLREAGLPGKISFDQLDTSLKDVFGTPESFNALTARIIAEIQETQIFRHMAANFTAQAIQENSNV